MRPIDHVRRPHADAVFVVPKTCGSGEGNRIVPGRDRDGRPNRKPEATPGRESERTEDVNKKDAFERRMCHINGARPTVRDRWQAFYRVHRMLMGGDMNREHGAHESLMVLFPTKWTCLVNAPTDDGLVDRSKCPLFLRRSLLDGIRRARLRKYGGNAERDRKVARIVREQHGIEATPEQVAEVRYKVMTLAREAADACGLRRPEHFDEVAAILREKS